MFQPVTVTAFCGDRGKYVAHAGPTGSTCKPCPCRRSAAERGTERGGIVAFRHPQKPQSVYIKRVVGLPNEHIALEDDRVLINGQPQPEPYLDPGSGTGRQYARQWFTDSGEYFLLGDNRGDSEDSRAFGPVECRLIIGRVWFRYWPPRVWLWGGGK